MNLTSIVQLLPTPSVWPAQVSFPIGTNSPAFVPLTESESVLLAVVPEFVTVNVYGGVLPAPLGTLPKE